MNDRGLRITRLEESLESDGFILSFTAPRALFGVVLEVIRSLNYADREYLPDERAWWISARAMYVVARAIPEVAASLAAEAARDFESEQRADRRQRSEFYRPTPPAAPPDVTDAYGFMYLVPGAPPELVKSAYRVLAKTHHPDTGGNHARMLALGRAYQLAQRWAERSHSA